MTPGNVVGDHDKQDEETDLEKAERKYREAVDEDKKDQQKDPKKRWGKS